MKKEDLYEGFGALNDDVLKGLKIGVPKEFFDETGIK